MKKGKTKKLTRRILSLVLTAALVVGLMSGNTLTAYAKADDIKYTPKVGPTGTDIYMDGYDTYIVDGTNPNTTAVYYYDNSGNQVYVNPSGAAGDDLSEYKIYSNGETYDALSGNVNIEMTGGSVGSIVIGYDFYGSGNDRTNVNVNISGGSCGYVGKASHYGKSWVFSEQIVPMNQGLTGYVTKTDSGWVAHGDAIIPEGKTVTVGAGEVFQIESGVTLTNNGTIVNNGTNRYLCSPKRYCNRKWNCCTKCNMYQ